MIFKILISYDKYEFIRVVQYLFLLIKMLNSIFFNRENLWISENLMIFLYQIFLHYKI